MASFTASSDLLVYTCEFDVNADEPLSCVVNTSFTATPAAAIGYVWDTTLLAYEDPAFSEEVLLDFCAAIRAALNAAVADTTWAVSISSQNKITIGRSSTFTIDWTGDAGQRMMATLGFTANLSGSTAYTATNTPWYYMQAEIAGRTEFSDVYEPDGDVVVSESVSVTGYSRAVSDENAELMVDWLQNMESYAATFTRGRAASLSENDWEVAAFTWQALLTYLRGERLLFVYNSFLGPAWTVHKMRASAATFRPERVIEDDNTYWGVPFKTREVGTIDVGAPEVTIELATAYTLGALMLANEVGNVTSRQWYRSSTWVGQAGTAVGWSAIAGATNATYAITPKVMGHAIRCVSTGTGGTGTSNQLRLDLGDIGTCREAWDIGTLSAGALTSLVGSIATTTLTQGTAGKRPVVSATSFGGTVGLTFDGVDDCLRVASTAVCASQNLRIVMALIDTATGDSIIMELTASVASQANAFAVGVNSGGAGRVNEQASSTAAAVGGTYASESLASACYMSFGVNAGATNGSSFIRKNGAVLSPTNLATGCMPAASLATSALNLGSRNDGASLPWAGVIGGAIVILSGTAQDADLADVEAYVGRGAGLV